MIHLCKHSSFRLAVAAVLLSTASLAGFADESPGSSEFVRKVIPDRASFGLSMSLTAVESRETALEVVEIREGGPAALAGIETGDVVVGIDGPLPPFENDVQSVVEVQRRYRAGDKVLFEVDRNGHRRVVKLQAEEMPAETQERLLRWLEMAEARLAAGESLYCDTSVQRGDDWAQFLMHASAFDFATLDIRHDKAGNLSFSAYPSHLSVPASLDLADLDPSLRKRVETLGPEETLRISLQREESGSSILQTIEVLGSAE